jgi:hypothetical protein
MASIQPGPTCNQGTAPSGASTPWAAIVGELSGSAYAVGVTVTVAVAISASVVMVMRRPSGVRRREVVVISVSFGKPVRVSVP